MNDNDLLFNIDDLGRWKNRDLPDDWMEQRTAILLARHRAQSESFARLLASVNTATSRRLDREI